MANRFNNRTLIIVLIVLVGIFLVGRMLRQKKSQGTLKTELVKIDTANISAILLYPQSENGQEILFSRQGEDWTVSKGDVSSDAEKNSIKNMFDELLNLDLERLVATNAEKWVDFGVNDSLGTRVVMKAGKKTVLDLIVGRFDYQPAPSGYGGYGGNYGSGLTYIRLSKKPQVYAVNGFLAMSFNQGFNSWRNQTFLKADKNNITRLTFDYPADSGFVASKSDTVWLINSLSADSASMANYLNVLSRRSNSAFVDDFSPVVAADFQLTIEGNNMEPLIIKAYRRNDNEFILNSSLNPESFFRSNKTGMFKNVFKSKNELVKSD